MLKRRTPAKKMRKAYENHNRAKDLSNSVWGQMLADPSVSKCCWIMVQPQVSSQISCTFFYVSGDCRGMQGAQCFWCRSKIKIEFKVLTCLKILGRDLCADEFDEHLNIAEGQ